MKIHLVTGATGFVGKYLVSSLLERGENVWIIVRPLQNVSAQVRAREIFHEYSLKWPTALRTIDGDIMNENLGIEASLFDELKTNEVALWHLAANLSFASENRADAQRTNYIGTANVVNFANKAAKEFMHMSTAYVCGNSPSFKESELQKGQGFRNHYEKSKFEAEKYVRENCQLPYIIFRPSVIIGDADRGNAEGCTFGYYRYMFMFYFFKKQIVKALRKNGFVAFFLKVLKTKHDAKNDILHMPFLVIPYPKNGRINLVTVDYVIESAISLYEKKIRNVTAHLTHNEPPFFDFMLHAVLNDLGYREMKLVPVPVWVFKLMVNCFYFFAIPVRKYIRSVMWYIPYFTQPCEFERSIIENYLENPPIISREVTEKINTYAKESILEHIKI